MKQILCLLLCLICFCVFLPASAERADPVADMTFFGESTTAHLALRGGIDPARVWTNAAGTVRLDSGILSRTLKDPADGSPCTVRELAAKYRPQVLVLSFGLNGIMGSSAHPDTYLGNYRRLIDAIREASPDTRFVIQSVCPVADAGHQADWKFSVPPGEINRKLTVLSDRLREFCRNDPTLTFADTASCLTDADGFLRGDLTTDGIHLTGAAYVLILDALRQSMNVSNA